MPSSPRPPRRCDRIESLMPAMARAGAGKGREGHRSTAQGADDHAVPALAEDVEHSRESGIADLDRVIYTLVHRTSLSAVPACATVSNAATNLVVTGRSLVMGVNMLFRLDASFRIE